MREILDYQKGYNLYIYIYILYIPYIYFFKCRIYIEFLFFKSDVLKLEFSLFIFL